MCLPKPQNRSRDAEDGTQSYENKYWEVDFKLIYIIKSDDKEENITVVKVQRGELCYM